MASSPVNPDAPKSRIPRRSPGRMVAAICISTAVLCALPLLPSPVRMIAVVMVIPVAAAFLPMIFFSASKLRCPACRKPLPLGYEGEECQVCGAPLDLKSAKPAARV